MRYMKKDRVICINNEDEWESDYMERHPLTLNKVYHCYGEDDAIIYVTGDDDPKGFRRGYYHWRFRYIDLKINNKIKVL